MLFTQALAVLRALVRPDPTALARTASKPNEIQKMADLTGSTPTTATQMLQKQYCYQQQQALRGMAF
jgi:hypothetical protein